MMKIIFNLNNILNIILYSIIFLQVQCPILDKMGLNPSHVKGSEAKIILRERLASFFIKDLTDDNMNAFGADFISANLAGISDDAFYKRRDVEHCATMIYMASLAIHKSNTAYTKNAPMESRTIPPLLCKLKPTKDILAF